jgi:hypothetical protein
MLDTIQRTLDTALEDDATLGTYRVGRDIFTDPAIFELEMKHIFEGNWIYLAHESQIPNNADHFTTTMGRQPVLIARSRTGELRYTGTVRQRPADAAVAEAILFLASAEAPTSPESRCPSRAGILANTIQNGGYENE